MYEMVATDGKAVTVTRNLPYRHLGVSHLETCCNRRGTAMDGVEAVGVHIIWQA